VNLRTLDLNLLLVFDALLRTRSTTLAAEELRLTQSAVSNALKRLRVAFSDPLFVKTPEGMLPTEFAQKLARPISEGLSSIRDAVETKSSFDPSTSDRTFHIYMSDIGQMVFMPKLIAELAKTAPKLKIVTVEVSHKDAQYAMATGGIDLAIGLFMNFSSGFHEQRLFREHYVAMVRRDHPREAHTETLFRRSTCGLYADRGQSCGVRGHGRTALRTAGQASPCDSASRAFNGTVRADRGERFADLCAKPAR
jgi:DNA-binding transcriptional LysR family regulator